MAPGFIRASSAAPINPSVLSVSGTCSDRTSARSRTCSSVSSSSISSDSARSCVRYGSCAQTRAPNARARRATSLPIRPAPTRPSVFPYSSLPVKLFRSHSPAFIERSAAGIRRMHASISANVSSAADTVLPDGALSTATPRSVAASTSMLSTPTPARPMTRRSSA
jgi:hypothetical protein